MSDGCFAWTVIKLLSVPDCALLTDRAGHLGSAVCSRHPLPEIGVAASNCATFNVYKYRSCFEIKLSSPTAAKSSDPGPLRCQELDRALSELSQRETEAKGLAAPISLRFGMWCFTTVGRPCSSD